MPLSQQFIEDSLNQRIESLNLDIGTLDNLRLGRKDFQNWGGLVIGARTWVVHAVAERLVLLRATSLDCAPEADYGWQRSKLKHFCARVQASRTDGTLAAGYIGRIGEDRFGAFGFGLPYGELVQEQGTGTTIEQRTTESKAERGPGSSTEPNSVHKDPGELVDAVHRGDSEAVAVLLAKGVNPNARERGGGPTDATVLMRAAEGGHMEIARQLLKAGADVNATWNVGSTALAMVAGNADTTDMMRLLIEHGAGVNARDEYGQTALTAAAVYDRVDNVRLLLDSGAQVNAKKTDGTTALTGAVQYGNTETVRLLLQRGATVDASPRNRETEQLMALAKKPEIAALLMTAAREQFVKAGNTQASPSMSRPTAAVSRPPRPAVISPGPDRPVAREQQASKRWWQFWK